MGEHVIKLPDVGEGVAEAELVEWHVKVGDLVREDTILGAVMTDKATVEMESPVAGTVIKLAGEVGDPDAVGSAVISPRGSSIVNAAGRFVIVAEAGDEIVIESTPPRTVVVPAEGGVRVD